MNRVFIVEDDTLILRGLAEMVALAGDELNLVGTATDGQMALELLAQVEADVVITDISMPFMDGIELSKQIHEKYPYTAIILLSGFETFEYAKQAIQLGVYDYLLKPISYEVLIEIIRGALHTVSEKRNTELRLTRSIPILQQQFLTQLLNGKITDDVLCSRAAFLNIALPQGPCAAVVITADDYESPGYEVIEQELLKYGIMNITQELILQQRQCVVWPGDEHYILCIVQAEKQAPLLPLFEQIRQTIEQKLKSTITIGIGQICNDIVNIEISYIAAKLTVDNYTLFDRNAVITCEDRIPEFPTQKQDFTQWAQKLCNNIKLGQARQSLALLGELQSSSSPTQAKWTIMQLVAVLCQIDSELKDIFGAQISMIDTEDLIPQLSRAKTLPRQFQILCGVVRGMCEKVSNARINEKDGLIQQATDYIDKNYSDFDLTLSNVAQQIHISPVYLSILFKQKRNINFSEYVLKTRLYKAQHILISTTLKTYEIAQMVGFHNPQYFSTCFKKMFGCTPGELRLKP